MLTHNIGYMVVTLHRACVIDNQARAATIMADRLEVVRLYRRILKLAQRYPSVKRDSIVRDIKTEFHENKALSDAQQVREKVMAARAGIQELSQYAALHPSAASWTVEVGRDALPTAAPPKGNGIKTVGGKRE